MMPAKKHHIIVLGTSAGGIEALDSLIGQLRPNIPASIFVVQHMPTGSSGEGLLYRLGKYKHFKCTLATNGETFEAGRIYIAPPDKHLLVRQATVEVVRGAAENRYRPAIDPLFRTAAVEHGSHVIGAL